MTDMILRGDSYEKSCCKWSGTHSGSNIWVWDITLVILGVILGVIIGVVYMILTTKMVMGGDSYEQRFRADPYIADDPAKYSLLRAP